MIWTSGNNDVWDRLGRLSALCKISIHAVHVHDPASRRTVQWELTIQPGSAAGPRMTIQVREPTLVEAVVRALAVAESQGWM